MGLSIKWVWRNYKAGVPTFPKVLWAIDECMTNEVVNVETASQAKAEPILTTDLCTQYKWLSSWKELEMGQ